MMVARWIAYSCLAWGVLSIALVRGGAIADRARDRRNTRPCHAAHRRTHRPLSAAALTICLIRRSFTPGGNR